MLVRGSQPFLECSTHGDRRFSAFCARPSSLGGRSIEEAYQAMKVFEDGRTGLSWRAAKGHRPINIEACRLAYDRWWLEWVREQTSSPPSSPLPASPTSSAAKAAPARPKSSGGSATAFSADPRRLPG